MNFIQAMLVYELVKCKVVSAVLPLKMVWKL